MQAVKNHAIDLLSKYKEHKSVNIGLSHMTSVLHQILETKGSSTSH